MFVLVVTGKKELADDKAVLLSNAHHGLRLLKLDAGCILHSARLGGSSVAFLLVNAPVNKIILVIFLRKAHL